MRRKLMTFILASCVAASAAGCGVRDEQGGFGTESTEALEEERKEAIEGGISKEEALALVEMKFGATGEKDADGNEKSYVFEGVQEADGEEYYSFRYSWITYGEESHADAIVKAGNIFVPSDGSEPFLAEEGKDGWILHNKGSKMRIYAMQPSDGEAEAGILILYDDGTFQLDYKTGIYGDYEEDDGIAICNSLDGGRYRFEITDAYAKFIKNKSSAAYMPDDGTVFRIQQK